MAPVLGLLVGGAAFLGFYLLTAKDGETPAATMSEEPPVGPQIPGQPAPALHAPQSAQWSP